MLALIQKNPKNQNTYTKSKFSFFHKLIIKAPPNQIEHNLLLMKFNALN